LVLYHYQKVIDKVFSDPNSAKAIKGGVQAIRREIIKAAREILRNKEK
jgi:hypothetical protein